MRLQCRFNYTQHCLEFWKAFGITSTDGDLCHCWRGLHSSWSYMVLVTLVVGLLWPTQSDYGLGRRLILGGITVVLSGCKIIHIQSKTQLEWVGKGFFLQKQQKYVRIEIHKSHVLKQLILLFRSQDIFLNACDSHISSTVHTVGKKYSDGLCKLFHFEQWVRSFL